LSNIALIHKLLITERDRSLAAGLLSFVVTFFLFSPANLRSVQPLIILGVFAAGASVFSVSPLVRGSGIQRFFAILFLLPPLAYAIILVTVLGSGRFE
jgi:hypothetical protein